MSHTENIFFHTEELNEDHGMNTFRVVAFLLESAAVSVVLIGTGGATGKPRLFEVHGVPMNKETVTSGRAFGTIR